jgi:hypothetical protein
MNRYPLFVMLVVLGLCWSVSLLFPLSHGLGFVGKVTGLLVVSAAAFLL